MAQVAPFKARRELLADCGVDRAVYVADTIERRLWPQQELFRSAEESEEPS
jgi:hypothetical protein